MLRSTLCSLFVLAISSSCAIEEGDSLSSTSAALTFGSVGAAIRVESSGQCWTHDPVGSTIYVAQQPCVSAQQAWFTASPAADAGYFVIRSANRCLDVIGASTAPGAQLQLYPCTGNNNQMFQLIRSGGSDRYEIRPKLASSLCLDIAWGDAVPGRALQQHGCHGGANQRFRFRPVLETFEDTCDQGDILRAVWTNSVVPADIHIGVGEVWYHAARSITLICDGSSEVRTCPSATSIIEVSRLAPDRVRSRCYQ